MRTVSKLNTKKGNAFFNGLNGNGVIKPRRLLSLIRREYRFQLKEVLIVFGAIIAGFTLISSLGVIFDANSIRDITTVTFVMVLLIGGPIFNSMIYEDRYQKKWVNDYLTLPVSRMELFITRLLSGSIGLVLFLLIASFVSSLLLSLLAILAGNDAQLFNPFSPAVVVAVLLFVPLQAIYFFGSCFFRGAVWLKTTGLMIVFGFFILFTASLATGAALIPTITRLSHFDLDYQFDDQIENYVERINSSIDSDKRILAIEKIDNFKLKLEELEEQNVDTLVDVNSAFKEAILEVEILSGELVKLDLAPELNQLAALSLRELKSFYNLLIWIQVLFWICYLIWITLFCLGSWLSLGESEVTDAV